MLLLFGVLSKLGILQYTDKKSTRNARKKDTSLSVTKRQNYARST